MSGAGDGKRGAMKGLRVVDLSRVLGAPLAAQMLADHGADVIKVEPPRGDEMRDMGAKLYDGGSPAFINVNRNKRGIGIDLSKPEGREVLMRFLEKADVLIENFKSGTMEAWGIGYDELAKRFPRLIHATLTGFGPDGPLGGHPGYDVMAQAWTGLISINGSKESGPLRMGVPVVDMTTGANMLIGILMALYEREHSGAGQHIDVCLYDSGIALTHPQGMTYLLDGKTPGPMGNEYATMTPYGFYKAKDQSLFIAVGNDLQFRRLCDVLGKPEIGMDPRFSTNPNRLANKKELHDWLNPAVASWEGAKLCDTLLAKGVPAGLLQTIPDVFNHPHTLHRQMLVSVDEYRGAGIPVKMSRTPGNIYRRPPRFNEHAKEILEEAGYSASDIERLHAQKVVIGERANKK